MKTRLIIAVMQTTYAVVKLKSEKDSDLNGLLTQDLCDTGEFSGFNFTTAKLCV